MLLTVIHHIYGAVIYDEPFRQHAAIFAIPVILVLMATYAGVERMKSLMWRKVLLAIFLVVTVVFPLLAIGLYEGGYNHVVKNLLYFSGVPTHILDQLYPSIYELPNDLVFELTGMMQLLTGVQCGLAIYRSSVRRWFQLLNNPA
jgi:hypothetical protein